MARTLDELFERLRDQDDVTDAFDSPVRIEKRLARIEAALGVVVEAIVSSGTGRDALMEKLEHEIRSAWRSPPPPERELPAEQGSFGTPYRGGPPPAPRDPTKDYCTRCARVLEPGSSYSFTSAGNVCSECLRADDIK